MCRSVEEALSHRGQLRSRAAASQRGGVHKPRVAEQVDHLAAPALGGGAVDEERVLQATVDRLCVGAKDVEFREVLRALGDGAEVLGAVQTAAIVIGVLVVTHGDHLAAVSGGELVVAVPAVALKGTETPIRLMTCIFRVTCDVTPRREASAGGSFPTWPRESGASEA
jgi:hypothetical protein